MTSAPDSSRPTISSDAGRKGEMLRLDNQLCFQLYAASNLMTRLYRPILKELGLTYPQYLVMLLLWEGAPRSVGDIGASLHLDSGTLTPLLKRLEAASLVVRRRDTEDERRVLVDLTAAGTKLRERAEDVPSEAFRCLSISGEEATDLREALRGLVVQLAASTGK